MSVNTEELKDKAFILFFRYNKTLGEVAKELNCTIYDLTPFLTSESLRLSRISIDDNDFIYVRDADGTRSMHPCSKSDPGAIKYVRVSKCNDVRCQCHEYGNEIPIIRKDETYDHLMENVE